MSSMEEQIKEHLNQTNLKKIKSIPAVYFEQKITPDLLWPVAVSILEFCAGDIKKTFTDDDILSSDSFKMFIRRYFGKPEYTEKTENEYNKVVSYQLGLLAFSGILKIVGVRPKNYKIEKFKLLEFISQNEMTTLFFLETYVEKFLRDNGLMTVFNDYKSEPNQENYEKAKKEFWKWSRENTNVRTLHPQHSYRVFNKIFNLFAHANDISGQEKSLVRVGICPYEYLRYNRPNFRDTLKPKTAPRKEYEKILLMKRSKEQILQHMIAKSKEEIKERHKTSEITERRYTPGEPGRIDAHHIFRKETYPEFAAHRENLISLMAGQHQAYSHKEGTRYVDEKFQIVCLLAKLKSIEDSLRAGDRFYNLKKFIEILNVGLKLNLPENIRVESIRNKLEDMKRKLD